MAAQPRLLVRLQHIWGDSGTVKLLFFSRLCASIERFMLEAQTMAKRRVVMAGCALHPCGNYRLPSLTACVDLPTQFESRRLSAHSRWVGELMEGGREMDGWADGWEEGRAQAGGQNRERETDKHQASVNVSVQVQTSLSPTHTTAYGYTVYGCMDGSKSKETGDMQETGERKPREGGRGGWRKAAGRSIMVSVAPPPPPPPHCRPVLGYAVHGWTVDNNSKGHAREGMAQRGRDTHARA